MNSKVTDINTARNGAAQKTTWSGHILEGEMQRPGGMLLGALMAHSADRGDALTKLAQHVGVTYGYLSQLRSGLRNVKTISDKFARDCAEYLGVSVSRVLLMSGRLTAADFHEVPSDFERAIATAMSHICRDAHWGELITPALRGGDPSSQHAIVKLYEKATGTVLMPKHQEPGQALDKEAA